MDERLTRLTTRTERERFNAEVNKPFYQETEDYDWTEVADRLRGPESLMHRFRERELVRTFRRYHRPGRVLDLGCGSGLMLRHLPSGSIGVDLNPRNVARARRYAPNATVVLGDGENLPFANGQFSTVISTEVLEHLVFPERAIAEVLRVLEPGGVFLGSIPRHSILWKLRALSSTCPAEEPFHNEMTRKELEALLAPFPRFRVWVPFWLMQFSFVAWSPPSSPQP